MKLHLGCGEKYLEGFTHCDIRKYHHVDYVIPVDDLPFDDESVDEIYACHVLEHFGRHEVLNVLKEWSRVLKTDGFLRIAVPDFDSIVNHLKMELKGGVEKI
ncbi:MAG: methyltransferase domain-containing protein [Methanobrevibacter sp.]|jgi:predicted SAM-dependent methyltransferase|nr:methyltransferase domain-containing protein [Candidatus Methanoflexus mossambicus]